MPHINEPVQFNIYTNTMTRHELHSEIIKTAFIRAVLLIYSTPHARILDYEYRGRTLISPIGN